MQNTLLDSSLIALDTITNNIATTHIVLQTPVNNQIPITTFISSAITVFLFFLGLFISFFVKQWQLRTTMINQERYLEFWVDKTDVNVKKQVEALTAIADKIKSSRSGSLHFGVGNMHTDKLKAFTSIELVRMFVTNKKGDKAVLQDCLYKFIYHVDLLERLHAEGITNFEIYRSLSKQNSEDWVLTMGLFDQWFNNVYALGKEAIFKNEFYKQATKIREAFFEKFVAGSNIDNEFDCINVHLIQPLLLLCQQSIFSHGEKVTELTGILNNLAKLYLKKTGHNKQMGEIFMKLGSDIANAYLNVSSSKKMLVNCHFRFFPFLI